MEKIAFTEKEKSLIKEKLSSFNLKENFIEIIADCLATADLYGVTSHGISTLEGHVKRLSLGSYNLNPEFKVLRSSPSFAVIDGDNAVGAVSATHCINYAIENAKKVGMFTVFSKNNNTFGPAFYYPLIAARNGMIGFITSNSPAQMAPFNGKEKLLGTNPFSVVIPRLSGEPLIIDMATSVVAKSKIKEYAERNESIPEGWATDSEGNPTTNPNEAINGLVLPMAGFKGYGIALLIDILAGFLSGASFLNHVGRFYSENKNSMNVGFYMTVIDPKAVFGEDFYDKFESYLGEIKNSKNIDGKEIVLPGDDRVKYKLNLISKGDL